MKKRMIYILMAMVCSFLSGWFFAKSIDKKEQQRQTNINKSPGYGANMLDNRYGSDNHRIFIDSVKFNVDEK